MDQTAEFEKELQEVMKMNESFSERMNATLHLSIEKCLRDDKRAEVDFNYTRQELHLNPYGGVHGGMVCTVFDTAMGIGAVALCGSLVTTTDLSTSYLRALRGDHYLVHLEFTHIGRRMISSVGHMYDKESGELCATCMGSYIVIEGREKGLRV